MKKSRTNQSINAFSVLELLVVVGILCVLFMLIYPALGHPCQKAVRINCVNNLQQVGLSLRIWAGDNSDLYPMHYRQEEAWAPKFGDGNSIARCFQIMSNELNEPKVLFCPADKKRNPAKNFTSDFNNTHISYFLSWDASETNNMMVVSGDRNLTNGLPLDDGTMALSANPPAGWTAEIHNKNGNVLLTDGSVRQISCSGLRDTVRVSGVATNRLAFP